MAPVPSSFWARIGLSRGRCPVIYAHIVDSRGIGLKFLSTLALALAFLAAPAAAADLAATATYGVTLGGTHIANVTIRLNDTGKSYAMGLTARVTGLAQMVASGSVKANSAGISTGSGLVAQQFDMLTRAQGQDISVKVEYTGRDVTEFIVTPPILNNIDRVPLERKQLTGVNDMLAPFVLKGGKLDPDLCNRNLKVFTGVERFNVTLRFQKADTATSKRTGYQGPLILCTARYVPVSGHYTTAEITTYLAQSERILVWFAPLETPGYYIPYRAVVGTTSGDLSVVLTELKQ